MKDKVLIDTSVWIDYLKNKDKSFSEKVDKILNYYNIHLPEIVVAELIQGAKSEKEIKIIEEFINIFNIVYPSENTWTNAGRLSFTMKRKGITVSLIDCYIAVLTNENNCRLFSLDKHFSEIKNFLNIELVK